MLAVESVGARLVEEGVQNVQARYFGAVADAYSQGHTMRRLLEYLCNGINPWTGIGQMRALEIVAQEIGTTEETIRNYLKRAAKAGWLIKSNGMGVALAGKGIAYALTFPKHLAGCQVLTNGGAENSGTACVPVEATPGAGLSGLMWDCIPTADPDDIDAWLAIDGLFPAFAVACIQTAKLNGKAQKTISNIAYELWAWFVKGWSPAEYAERIFAAHSTAVRILAQRAIKAGRME